MSRDPEITPSLSPDAVSVTVVVPTSRRAQTLRHTLHRLALVDFPGQRFEVVVVNDGRDDETEPVVQDFRHEFRAITYVSQVKAGAGAARNHGARVADGDLLLFLDDDISVEPAHLDQHVRTHAAHGNCLVNGREEWPERTVASLRQTPLGRFRVSLKDTWRWPQTKGPFGEPFFDPQALVACSMSIRQDAFWSLGGFDEAFPMGGAEDRDFGLRAAQGGYPLIRNDAIKVWHDEPLVTLRQMCLREERYARGITLLAAKYPELYRDAAFINDNQQPSRSDRPTLVAKKITKAVLSRQFVLTGLTRVVTALEQLTVPDRHLRRMYSGLLGLHIYRGVRRQSSA